MKDRKQDGEPGRPGARAEAGAGGRGGQGGAGGAPDGTGGPGGAGGAGGMSFLVGLSEPRVTALDRVAWHVTFWIALVLFGGWLGTGLF